MSPPDTMYAHSVTHQEVIYSMKTTNTKTFRLAIADVWGNARDGWDHNGSHYSSITLELSGNESDRTINRRIGGLRGVEWDGDPEFGLHGTFKRNGKPFGELIPE